MPSLGLASCILTTLTSSSILATMSTACVERESKRGLSDSKSTATSDESPVGGPTFFFATSTTVFACSTSLIVLCSAAPS